MWDCEMPIGVPKIHTEFPGDCNAWIQEAGVGFATVNATTPKDLLHPVLPTRDGTVNFTCEDIIEGSYTLVELKAAIQRGYKVTKIYEAHTYQSMTELWRPYIRRFLRGKIANNGMPNNVEQFIMECKERYDIDLTPQDFRDNVGYKSICKLLLNSVRFHARVISKV